MTEAERMPVAEAIGAPEAARRVGLTREQLIRRIERGEIEAQVVAGRYLIPESSLREFIARRDRAEGRVIGPTVANGGA